MKLSTVIYIFFEAISDSLFQFDDQDYESGRACIPFIMIGPWAGSQEYILHSGTDKIFVRLFCSF